MNFNSNNDRLFAFLIYFSTLTIFVKSDLNRALTFDRNTGALINIKVKIENERETIQHELAVACPAESPSEDHFNKEHSFGKNSLFVKGTYERTESPSSVLQNICAEGYKLSITYHKQNDEFMLGYEVYYDSKKYKPFKPNYYINFTSVANAYLTNSKKTKLLSKLGFSNSKPKLELKEADGKKITLEFLWIAMVKFKFDNSTKTPKEVIYTLGDITGTGVHCEDYNLGNEIYNQENIDLLYNDQIKIFKNVEIPEADKGCETGNNCLTKYSLVPAQEFHVPSLEPMSVSCSNLVTVPIWTSAIGGVLQKLDQFLYALVQFADGILTVLSGVHGQLKMKSSKLQGTTEIFLGSENTIPAPDIVYKVIKYEFFGFRAAKKSDGEDNDYQMYEVASVILVFHNDPEFDPKDALCPENKCIDWGWGEILFEADSSSSTTLSKYNYCCLANEEIMKKLGVPYDTYDSMISKELDLTHFPTFDSSKKQKRIENIEQHVIKEMKNLFGEKSTPEGVA